MEYDNKVTISVTQIDSRKFSKSQDYSLTEISATLYLPSGQMMGHSRSQNQSIDLEADLNKGKYFVKVSLSDKLC